MIRKNYSQSPSDIDDLSIMKVIQKRHVCSIKLNIHALFIMCILVDNFDSQQIIDRNLFWRQNIATQVNTFVFFPVNSCPLSGFELLSIIFLSFQIYKKE